MRLKYLFNKIIHFRFVEKLKVNDKEQHNYRYR